MSLRERDIVTDHRDTLRHEPIDKRVRAVVDGQTVLDTVEAQVVWEPRRVLCQYAVPEAALGAELVPAAALDEEPPAEGVLGPDVAFGVHTAPGTPLDVHLGDRVLAGAAYRLEELDGLLILDFDAFDEWWHEDEQNVGHPRDPFHRVEALPSSRRVRVELDGELLAESSRPVVVFESELPARFYLPAEDVMVALAPSDTVTTCPYKGQAAYGSVEVGGRTVTDAAWSYPEALHDVATAQGYWCFDDELVEVTVDAAGGGGR